MSRVLSKKVVEKQLQFALDTQQKGENCIYFHKVAGAVSIASHREFLGELFMWKRIGQIEKLEVRKSNCVELVRNHKKFYTIVFQPKSDADVCPIGLMCFNYMVSGYVYYFTDKDSRDIVLRMFQDVHNGKVID
jgi:hypothetical protein